MTYNSEQLAEAATASRRTQRYLTTPEVAELLRVPSETVRAWRHTGKGPRSFKIPGGRRVLYAVEDVEAFIASARTGSAA